MNSNIKNQPSTDKSPTLDDVKPNDEQKNPAPVSIEPTLTDDESDERHHVIESDDKKKEVVVPVMPLV